MKLTLRLITNKTVPIDLDFHKYMDQGVSMMHAISHSEQMVQFAIPDHIKDFNPIKIKQAIQEVIKKQYPNITSIEGLQELDKLIHE